MVNNNLIWAAGFFDGEGCIKVSKSKVNYSKGYRHTLVIHITQKIKSPLNLFKKLFGGKIYSTKKGKFTGYEYLIHNENAIKLLKTINPFLKLKKDESMLALKYGQYFLNKNNRVSNIIYNNRDKLHIKLKTIKDKKYDRV